MADGAGRRSRDSVPPGSGDPREHQARERRPGGRCERHGAARGGAAVRQPSRFARTMSIWRRSSGCCCRTGDCRGGWAQTPRSRELPASRSSTGTSRSGAGRFRTTSTSRSSPTSTTPARRSRWTPRCGSRPTSPSPRRASSPRASSSAARAITSRRPRTMRSICGSQSASLNLAAIQGFTTAVTNVGGTLQADVRVEGSGRDPHLTGFIEIRDGAFAVPRFGTSYGGLDTRIDLEPDLVRIRRFEILDENGEQLAVSGQLAVHERAGGRRRCLARLRELRGDRQRAGRHRRRLAPQDHGTAAAAEAGGRRSRGGGPARGRPHPAALLRSLPDDDAATGRAGGADRTDRWQRGRGDTDGTRESGAGRGPPVPTLEEAAAAAERKTSTSPMENVALDVRIRIPDNLVLRGRKLRPGGPTAAAMGD